MPLNSTLILGSQSLFGSWKRNGAVVQHRGLQPAEGERSEIEVEGGAQTQVRHVPTTTKPTGTTSSRNTLSINTTNT